MITTCVLHCAPPLYMYYTSAQLVYIYALNTLSEITLYKVIAIVILLYFGPMGKLKFQFSLSVSTQFDLYQYQSGEHVES